MPTPPMTHARAREILAALTKAQKAGHPEKGAPGRPGATAMAAIALGVPRGGIFAQVKRAREILGQSDGPSAKAIEKVSDLLQRSKHGIRLDTSDPAVVAALEQMEGEGFHVVTHGGLHSLNRTPQPGFVNGAAVTIYSDKHNRFKFGAMGDTHIGSQHFRQDVLDDLYRQYQEAGVTNVFHTGNYIEGESRFNKHELTAHSMAGQVKLMSEVYPKIKGIKTYAISGDDHEGWYAQREGINIGQYTEDRMRRAGRDDWHDLGYMEAHVRLVNSNTGKEAVMSVVHPGGGSAYATSYAIQKIVESLDGGEKPAIGLYGHYHKLWAGNIRNVWVVQTGTTQDQSMFMRKKKLEAHVGGTLVELKQDPATGAILSMCPELIRYFVKGYYQNRWGHGEPVQHAKRAR